jgi:hypothetical protein
MDGGQLIVDPSGKFGKLREMYRNFIPGTLNQIYFLLSG